MISGSLFQFEMILERTGAEVELGDCYFLRDFSDIIEFDSLHLNNPCWNGAFPEFNERKNMMELLDTVREEVLN